MEVIAVVLVLFSVVGLEVFAVKVDWAVVVGGQLLGLP